MKITKSELIEMDACKDGLARFIKQTGGVETPVDTASLVGGENTYGDLLWLAGKKLPRDRIVRFACDCALINIELIKPHTNKYELIVEFLNNPTADTRAAYYAARAAAYDAYTAARAATAVRAAAAARTAFYVTADAVAAAAYYAAAADAAAAYYAAAGDKEKVDVLLRELLS